MAPVTILRSPPFLGAPGVGLATVGVVELMAGDADVAGAVVLVVGLATEVVGGAVVVAGAVVGVEPPPPQDTSTRDMTTITPITNHRDLFLILVFLLFLTGGL